MIHDQASLLKGYTGHKRGKYGIQISLNKLEGMNISVYMSLLCIYSFPKIHYHWFQPRGKAEMPTNQTGT